MSLKWEYKKQAAHRLSADPAAPPTQRNQVTGGACSSVLALSRGTGEGGGEGEVQGKVLFREIVIL